MNGLELGFSIDQPTSHWFVGLYRVQLTVGNSVLTRAYTANHNSAQPAGAWAKRE